METLDTETSKNDDEIKLSPLMLNVYRIFVVFSVLLVYIGSVFMTYVILSDIIFQIIHLCVCLTQMFEEGQNNLTNIMKFIMRAFALCLLVFLSNAALSAKKTEAETVREIIDKVNRHWQKENVPEVRSFWDNAAYHTGNMEAYFLTGNEEYRAYSEAWAEHNHWKGAKSNRRSEWKYSYGETDEYVLFGA